MAATAMDRQPSDFFDLAHNLLDILKTEDESNILDFETMTEMLDIDLAHGGVPAYPIVITSPYPCMGDELHQPAPSSSHNSANNNIKTPDESAATVASLQLNRSSSDEDAGGGDGGKKKKKRTRNSEQMALNRVAQQKYRERKKSESQQLHNALEQMTAQLAALTAVEIRAEALERQVASLSLQNGEQAATIKVLETQVTQQSSSLQQTAEQLSQAQALIAQQQGMILDQHTKLRFQEQIITSLKDRLKESIDDALSHVDTQQMCQRLIAAVKSALYGAKDVEGLQELLEKLPDELVVELCKTIFHACKDMFPELMAKCSHLPCSRAQAAYTHYMGMQQQLPATTAGQ